MNYSTEEIRISNHNNKIDEAVDSILVLKYIPDNDGNDVEDGLHDGGGEDEAVEENEEESKVEKGEEEEEEEEEAG